MSITLDDVSQPQERYAALAQAGTIRCSLSLVCIAPRLYVLHEAPMRPGGKQTEHTRRRHEVRRELRRAFVSSLEAAGWTPLPDDGGEAEMWSPPPLVKERKKGKTDEAHHQNCG